MKQGNLSNLHKGIEEMQMPINPENLMKLSFSLNLRGKMIPSAYSAAQLKIHSKVFRPDC
jgi:hypothetical protein